MGRRGSAAVSRTGVGAARRRGPRGCVRVLGLGVRLRRGVRVLRLRLGRGVRVERGGCLRGGRRARGRGLVLGALGTLGGRPLGLRGGGMDTGAVLLVRAGISGERWRSSDAGRSYDLAHGKREMSGGGMRVARGTVRAVNALAARWARSPTGHGVLGRRSVAAADAARGRCRGCGAGGTGGRGGAARRPSCRRRTGVDGRARGDTGCGLGPRAVDEADTGAAGDVGGGESRGTPGPGRTGEDRG